jgi:hypothetical protein
MIGGTIFGIYGILLMAILLLINLVSYDFLGVPYLTPFVPTINASLKDSIIKFPTIKQKERNRLLTNNITKNVTGEDYD